jgi:hypothetical protein
VSRSPSSSRCSCTVTSRRRPTNARAASSASRSCRSLTRASRSATSSSGTWSGRSADGVPSSRLKGNSPPSRAVVLEEALEDGDVVVGLAREPEDEVGAEDRVGVQPADPFDQRAEALVVAGAGHPADHRARRRAAATGRSRTRPRRARPSSRAAARSARRAAGTSAAAVRCRRRRELAQQLGCRSRPPGRSLPHEVVFSLTSTSSLAPCSASHAASATSSSSGRERNRPRNDGIAQKVQSRSQPDAILR